MWQNYFLVCVTAFSVAILGTLRNYDGDRQGEPKKSNSLISKTTTLHTFWYISLLSLFNYDVKWPNFSLLEKENGQGDKFYHFCLNSVAVRSLQLQSKFTSF